MEQGVGPIMTIVDFDTRSAIPNSEGIIWDHCKMGASNIAFAGIRPFATVDKSKIMFAANVLHFLIYNIESLCLHHHIR